MPSEFGLNVFCVFELVKDEAGKITNEAFIIRPILNAGPQTGSAGSAAVPYRLGQDGRTIWWRPGRLLLAARAIDGRLVLRCKEQDR